MKIIGCNNRNMNTLADRIKQRLADLKKTQAGLAKYCKIRPPSVSKWLNGSTKTLRGQNLLRASEYLKCDPDWLATGKGFWNDKKIDTGNSNYEQSPFLVEMLDTSVLGQFIINTSDIEPAISHIEYTETQYRRLFSEKDPEDLRITNIKVDNMSGTLEPGDLVFINVSINKYDGDGVYLFIVGNHLHLKRLQMAGNSLLVISDNRQYKSWEISSKDKSNLVVVGKVLLGQSQLFQRF